MNAAQAREVQTEQHGLDGWPEALARAHAVSPAVREVQGLVLVARHAGGGGAREGSARASSDATRQIRQRWVRLGAAQRAELLASLRPPPAALYELQYAVLALAVPPPPTSSRAGCDHAESTTARITALLRDDDGATARLLTRQALKLQCHVWVVRSLRQCVGACAEGAQPTCHVESGGSLAARAHPPSSRAAASREE